MERLHQRLDMVLTWEQVQAHDLPLNTGKEGSPRKAAFESEYGQNVQVEMDALPPDELRQVFADAIEPFWDNDVFEAVLET